MMSISPDSGRTRIVVTGAASGIGLATLRLLREPGTAVVGVDVAPMPEEFAGMPGLEWIQGDVATKQTWDGVLQRLGGGGADCLIACAADMIAAPFLATPIEQWRRLFEINVVGVIRAFQTLLPAMIARGRGAVAVVCSVNSLYAEDQLSAYSMTKAALLQVVRSAALEYARQGVRINAVCPGAIDTPLLQRHLSALDDPVAARRAAARRTPTGRILKPEEIATVLRFLTSPDASGMSGAAVVVDGGLTTAYDFDSGMGVQPPT
jgi:NAD(P)-dependent dehydrogenase (short-subunit alcohol dehydrogenase family)